jgi:glutaredoxin
MGKIIAYCRKGCPHSLNTSNTLKQLKDNNIEIIDVENDETEKTKIKQQLKDVIGNHNTFPIIIYKTSKNKYYLVGGNSDLQNILQKRNMVKTKEDVVKLNLNKGSSKLLYYLIKK